MTALARSLIAEIRQAGAVLSCSIDRRVRFAAHVPLPPELLARARAHRDSIADALLAEDAAPANTPPDPQPLPEPGTPERKRWDTDHAQMVRGLLDTARQRPPAWYDAAANPSRGCWCSCCNGQRWWREREAPKGWRCGTCQPPLHLNSDLIRWIVTWG
jgi:hypothetical protein